MNYIARYFWIACLVGAPILGDQTHHNDYSPDKTVIAWDFHETLGNRNALATMLGIVRALPTLARVVGVLCYEAVACPISGRESRTYKLFSDIRKRVSIKNVTAEDFKPILDDYDPSLWPMVLSIYSEYRPIAGIQEIINELHALGYEQRIATNMSGLEFEEIKKRNAELFVHFKEGLTVKTLDQDPEFPRKPHPLYFEILYLLILKERAQNMNVIFIDDKVKNCKAAESNAHITALRFISVEKLRADLKARCGVTLPDAPQ